MINVRILGIPALLCVLGQATPAMAGSWGAPYVAAGAGYTVYDGVDDIASDRDDVARQRITKNAFGFIGYAGWTFPSQYSLEISYADFGEFEIDERWTDGVNTADAKATGGITGMGFGVRYDWQYSDVFDIYGRTGIMRWEATWDVTIRSTAVPTTIKGSSDTNGSEFYVGVGGQYELANNLFLYAEGYYLDAQFDQDGFGVKEPVYALFGGVMFRFGSPGKKNSTTDHEGLDVTACDPKYRDISGVACD